MKTKQEKLQSEIRVLQMLWVMGAIERLANLGELENPPFHVSDTARWEFADSVRDKLVPDRALIALTRNILKEDGASEQMIATAIGMLVVYRDDREYYIRRYAERQFA
jgi:hypothetical protein